MKLSDARHAFITGGASGIGLAIGEALGARGVAVTLADIDGAALERVGEARGASSGMRFRGQRLDVRDREGWARAKAEAEAAFGPVDILVNNAGISPDGNPLADMPPENWDRVIGINLTGVFNGVSAFGAAMRALGRGHIVNTASMAGLRSTHPGLGSYGAAKAGVVMLSEVLAREMAPHGVGVSVLCPGMVATGLASNTEKITGIARGDDSVLKAMGIAPAVVAEMVLGAIEADQLYIITHKDDIGEVGERLDAIRAAFDG
jgi:NAD(P)-dependent dehydrogenase (short-subunit alcohol dehydrogenase family)